MYDFWLLKYSHFPITLQNPLQLTLYFWVIFYIRGQSQKGSYIANENLLIGLLFIRS